MGNCACNGYNSSSTVDRNHNHHHHHHKISPSSSSLDLHHQTMIKVVTPNGGIMELYAPITADQITSEFPGQGLFRSPDPAHSPLLHNDQLHPGQLYYLLPLSSKSSDFHQTTPYRMSFDAPRVSLKRSSEPYSAPKPGVWKVRLVINPEQLSEILSQEAKTEELIGSVRTVAKCGGACGGASSSASSDSDQRSVASYSLSWKNSLP